MEALFDSLTIYWFSASGNSLLLARAIQAFWEERGLRVRRSPLDRGDPAAAPSEGALCVVVPVAGQGSYPFVWEFLRALPAGKGRPFIFVDSLGLYSGGILGPVRGIVERKGYLPLAATEILMPNIFMKSRRGSEGDDALAEAGKAKAEAFCESILRGEARWTDLPLVSDFLSLFYRYRPLVALWRSFFPWRVDPRACIRCGLCAELCPEACISLEGAAGTPSRGDRCSLCHRCFEFCPAGAITIGSKAGLRYRAVSSAEMLAELGPREGHTAAEPSRPSKAERNST